MLDQAIVTTIKNDTALETKLTDGAIFHVYPLRITESVLPHMAISYTLLSQPVTYPQVRMARYQFNCFAQNYDDARGLAEDIVRVFDDQSEVMLGGLSAVKYTKVDNVATIYDVNSQMHYFAVEVVFKY